MGKPLIHLSFTIFCYFDGKLFKSPVQWVFMEKAVLSGKKIIEGGRAFDVERIICVANTDIGTSVTLRSGESMIVADDYYSVADMCPWAARC